TGRSGRRSPVVSTTTNDTVETGRAAPSTRATSLACHRANALPRVAIRSVGLNAAAALPRLGIELEQLPQRLRQPFTARSAGLGLDRDGGLVQQLGHDAPGEGLDGCRLGRIEASQPPAKT